MSYEFWCPKASFLKETSDVTRRVQEKIRLGEVSHRGKTVGHKCYFGRLEIPWHK